MTDFFALLQQPRLPWLESGPLKEKYHELTRATHPDVARDANGEDFEAINEAYRVLADPKLRLQHLLDLESASIKTGAALPNDLEAMFLEIAALMQELRSLRGELEKSTNQLGRSLLEPRRMRSLQRAAAIRQRLDSTWLNAMNELQKLSNSWNADKMQTLAKLIPLHARLCYLSRWREQLAEVEFQLTQT